MEHVLLRAGVPGEGARGHVNDLVTRSFGTSRKRTRSSTPSKGVWIHLPRSRRRWEGCRAPTARSSLRMQSRRRTPGAAPGGPEGELCDARELLHFRAASGAGREVPLEIRGLAGRHRANRVQRRAVPRLVVQVVVRPHGHSSMTPARTRGGAFRPFDPGPRSRAARRAPRKPRVSCPQKRPRRAALLGGRDLSARAAGDRPKPGPPGVWPRRETLAASRPSSRRAPPDRAGRSPGWARGPSSSPQGSRGRGRTALFQIWQTRLLTPPRPFVLEPGGPAVHLGARGVVALSSSPAAAGKGSARVGAGRGPVIPFKANSIRLYGRAAPRISGPV
jgi:hypothetical protein